MMCIYVYLFFSPRGRQVSVRLAQGDNITSTIRGFLAFYFLGEVSPRHSKVFIFFHQTYCWPPTLFLVLFDFCHRVYLRNIPHLNRLDVLCLPSTCNAHITYTSLALSLTSLRMLVVLTGGVSAALAAGAKWDATWNLLHVNAARIQV